MPATRNGAPSTVISLPAFHPLRRATLTPTTAFVQSARRPAALRDMPGRIDGAEPGHLRSAIRRRIGMREPDSLDLQSAILRRERGENPVTFRPQKIFLIFGTSDSGM